MNEVKAKPVNEQSTLPTDLKDLILFNDDVNTFDYVIHCLIEVCNHTAEQAEQCAIIAHFKGKCPVKSGSFDELKPLADELTRRLLTVEIQ
ncbi:MAG: ATP-dependent Clp protease adaptor protein ClpS [Bacteroidales bacterium]|jgi:ATP-dependent Clp protease adaptor protein ClpS|nr:ATP-dependent Clp protease adaptor protein ClpS [Bacteroidales bacterium]MDN5330494.1 ATP-dependent Clp protease adaptor protein ClpS [Bacteroidales bacterium]